MIGEQEARDRILQTIRRLPERRIMLTEAVNRFAAKDYLAQIALPVFDNSAMDGYAVVASSCSPGCRLRVSGEQPAGIDRELRISPGEAIRIFTGAPIPSGADAVVMQEEVTPIDDEIVVNATVAAGDFIRSRGCDLIEGQRILAKGERIRATTVALLASQGLQELAVGEQIDASVISTGDELAEPGRALKCGQIYDSNSVLLCALLEQAGARVASIVHCSDQALPLEHAVGQGTSHHVVILTGGVSVGSHDLVKATLQRLGADIDVWRIAIKPGKPFLSARLGNSLVFGLPGNPVSAFVTFLRFVRPAILKLAGASETELELPKLTARLVADVKNEGERTHYMRGRLEHGNFAPIGRQESHALYGLSRSNALLRLAPGGELPAGTLVQVQTWD